jgi:signal transduction histidine kinase
MKLPSLLLARNDTNKNIPLVNWIWQSYFRTSLIPLLCVEIGLIVIYFLSNAYSNNQNIDALRELAESEAKQISILEAKGISNQLESISQSTAFLQMQTAKIMSSDTNVKDDPSRFSYSKDGVFYTTRDNGGSAVFYSGVVPIGEAERQKAYRSAALDPAYIGIKQSNSLIVQVYYNTFDSLNRIYPYMDVISQYSPKMDIPSFNFYYEADEKHNPQHKVVWTDVYKDPAGQGWMTSAIAPVYIKKKLEGVIGVDVTVSTIVNEVLDLKIPWNGYGLLISKNGNIIAIPQAGEKDWGKDEESKQKYVGEVNKDTLKSPELNIFQNKKAPKLVENIQKFDSGIMSADLGGKSIVSWAVIPETDWKLIITLPENEIFKSVQMLSSRLNRFAWLMVLGLLVFYFIFFIVLYRQSKKMSKSISEPLEKIDEMVRVVATGKVLNDIPRFHVAELSRSAHGVMTMGLILDHASRLRIQAESALLERTKQLQSVFDLSPDSLILINDQSKIVLVNPTFCKITSLSADDWLFNDEGFIWEKLAQLTADNQVTTSQHEQLFRLDLENPCKRVLQCQVLNINNETTTGFRLVHLRDITHEEEVNQMKNQFITTAAHELRTPLTTVLGYTELLMNNKIPAEMRQESFETVINKTKHLINIINEMLDLTRLEEQSGRDFNIIPIESDVLINSVVSDVKPPLNRQPVIVENIANLKVNVDKERFGVVINNLLENAYKYSSEGDVIIRTTHDNLNNRVGFHVQDFGLGMTEVQQSKAFDRFWRADDSGKIPGTGLGLSYVAEVVKRLSGSIEISSLIGRGTTVSIWLPASLE